MKRERSIQGTPPLELDEHALSQVVGGSGEDGWDLTGIPRPAWPYIRITDIDLKVNPAVVQKIASP